MFSPTGPGNRPGPGDNRQIREMRMSVTSGARGRIGVISDVICPWCYIGKRQLGRALPILAAEGQPFAVSWHAFQLNPDMPEEGVERDEYRTQKFGSLAESQAADARVAEAAA